MVDTVGLTLTATPLVAGKLPGVMTPVPPENTPVRVVLPPAVIVVEAAVKLEIEGGGAEVPELEEEPPQPVTPAKLRLRRNVEIARPGNRFM